MAWSSSYIELLRRSKKLHFPYLVRKNQAQLKKKKKIPVSINKPRVTNCSKVWWSGSHPYWHPDYDSYHILTNDFFDIKVISYHWKSSQVTSWCYWKTCSNWGENSTNVHSIILAEENLCHFVISCFVFSPLHLKSFVFLYVWFLFILSFVLKL